MLFSLVSLCKNIKLFFACKVVLPTKPRLLPQFLPHVYSYIIIYTPVYSEQYRYTLAVIHDPLLYLNRQVYFEQLLSCSWKQANYSLMFQNWCVSIFCLRCRCAKWVHFQMNLKILFAKLINSLTVLVKMCHQKDWFVYKVVLKICYDVPVLWLLWNRVSCKATHQS